jgi:HPt (histidine-containing phosphotransfer) domain-containing protein
MKRRDRLDRRAARRRTAVPPGTEALGRHLTGRPPNPVAAGDPAPRPGAILEGPTEVLDCLRRLETQGSPELVSEVIEIFLHDTTARLAALRIAVAEKDSDTVLRVAHTLKGSTSMIGANSMAVGCAALTTSARNGSFDHCETLVAELEARFETIRRALAGW